MRGGWACGPGALRGALSSHGSSPSVEICQCCLCPWLGEPWSFSLHGRATAKSPCGQWLLPSCTAKGNPLRAPQREMRIRPRVFLLGFYSCALPTARLGSLIDIFQGHRIAQICSLGGSGCLYQGEVHLIPARALGTLGKRRGHSSTSLCLT